MAKLALAAYDDTRVVTAGFAPVSATSFGMGKHSAAGSDVKWSFVNGTYRATLPGKLGEAFKDDAVATISIIKEASGLKTLAVAFRGTDGAAVDKVLGWGPQMKDGYYKLYEPLIEAIKDFARDKSIKDVLITGHSLGAAMAQYAMGDLADSRNTKYHAAIFGSPGAVDSGDTPDDRMIEFEYSQDAFTKLDDVPFVSFDHQGQRVVMPLDSTITSRDDKLGFYEHKMAHYLKAVKNFAALGGETPGFMTSDDFKGNSSTRTYAGGNGNDSLDGEKKSDALYGGAGNDKLRGLEGNDKLRGGEGNDKIYGNIGDDALSGGGGKDWLNGGTGKDIMHGGGGADTFAFSKQLLKGNVDEIRDFNPQQDRIALDNAVFSGLKKGYLQEAQFATGTASDSGGILYNSKSGKLYFDADGKGGDAAQLFAVVDPDLNISAGDFWVY